MLVLTRRDGETIRIGDDITILVVQSQCGRARIGIDAPTEVPVYREEVYERIQAENELGDGEIGQ